MTSPQDFADLLCAVAERHDRAAFARLFDHFAPRIKAYLLRLGLSVLEAEEMTQEVMVTLWRKAGLFDPQKSSVATWLYRIARNRRIDALRRTHGISEDTESLEHMFDETPAPEDSLDAAQRGDLVRSALGVLPDEQRELIRLAFFEEQTHSEIATRTGLPLGTVKSRIRLAFTHLRRALEDRGVTEAT